MRAFYLVILLIPAEISLSCNHKSVSNKLSMAGNSGISDSSKIGNSDGCFEEKITNLSNEDADMKWIELYKLYRVDKKSAHKSLVEALNNKDDNVRKLAIQCLGYGYKGQTEILLKSIELQPDKSMIPEIIRILEINGNTETLIEALKDENELIQETAYKVLKNVAPLEKSYDKWREWNRIKNTGSVENLIYIVENERWRDELELKHFEEILNKCMGKDAASYESRVEWYENVYLKRKYKR